MRLRVTSILSVVSLSAVLWFPAGWAESGGDIIVEPGKIDQLSDELRQRGWRVEKTESGDLLAFPVEVQPQRSDQEVEQSVAGKDNSATEGTTNLDQLESMLKGKGWEAKRNEAGDLLLYPRIFLDPEETKKVAPNPVIAQPESKTSQDTEIQLHELDRLEEEMKNRGWVTHRNEAGDLLLYPVNGKTDIDDNKGNSLSIKTVSLSSCPSSVGKSLEVSGVSLPVSSTDEAKSIAQAWILAGKKTGVVVGKIRQVNSLYIVSIVESSAEHSLVAQLVINSRDGGVIAIP